MDHVILTVVCSLDEDIREDMSGYMLRVSFLCYFGKECLINFDVKTKFRPLGLL